MKIAVVAGGWHWPWHFYETLSGYASGVDLFVVSHRDPELPIVREEKVVPLRYATGMLGHMDRKMYAEPVTKQKLVSAGWEYEEAPNVCGDQCFLNQWLDNHDFRDYDWILNCHDDTWIRGNVFDPLGGLFSDCLVVANGRNQVEPPGYFRGSFEFWSREMLDRLGGSVPLGDLRLTREGLTDSPESRQTLQTWNDTGVPVREYLRANGLTGRVASLSPHYRVSAWAIEGERGYLHRQAGGVWSMAPGLEAYPL